MLSEQRGPGGVQLVIFDQHSGIGAAVKRSFEGWATNGAGSTSPDNVREHLPTKMRGPVAKRMRAAYHADSAIEAQPLLEALAKELDKAHPRAALAGAPGWLGRGRQFRRVNEHLYPPTIRAALEGRVGVGADCNTPHVSAA